MRWKITIYRFDLGSPFNSKEKNNKKRGKGMHIFASVLLLALMLIGCTSTDSFPIPITSEQLCGVNPKEFDQYTLPLFKNWVRRKYGTEAEVTGDIYQWKEKRTGDANVYWVAGFQQEKLAYLSGSNLPKEYRFRELVRSFGDPESVSRFRDSLHETVYEIGLDFPSIGVSAYSWDMPKLRSNEKEIQLTDDFRIAQVLCYRSRHTMKEVIQDGLNLAPLASEIQIARRLPWPGFDTWISIENVP